MHRLIAEQAGHRAVAEAMRHVDRRRARARTARPPSAAERALEPAPKARVASSSDASVSAGSSLVKPCRPRRRDVRLCTDNVGVLSVHGRHRHHDSGGSDANVCRLLCRCGSTSRHRPRPLVRQQADAPPGTLGITRPARGRSPRRRSAVVAGPAARSTVPAVADAAVRRKGSSGPPALLGSGRRHRHRGGLAGAVARIRCSTAPHRRSRRRPPRALHGPWPATASRHRPPLRHPRPAPWPHANRLSLSSVAAPGPGARRVPASTCPPTCPPACRQPLLANARPAPARSRSSWRRRRSSRCPPTC